MCFQVLLYLIPFLHQTTTKLIRAIINYLLYLIPFLHQTTTHWATCFGKMRCILFHFYIKPQHCYIDCKVQRSCILFHFYIKPQQSWLYGTIDYVVSYSISTSNHNKSEGITVVILLYLIPFLHQTTTFRILTE